MTNKFEEEQIVIYKSPTNLEYKIGRIKRINHKLVITEIFRSTNIPEMVSIDEEIENEDIEVIFLLGEEKWSVILDKILYDIHLRLIDTMSDDEILNELLKKREITAGLSFKIEEELALKK